MHLKALRWGLIFAGIGILAGACSNDDEGKGTPSPPDTVSTQPNIIFIMTDDHTQQAISSLGGTLIDTPNIDRIAAGGVRFTNSFVTNSICAPSRAVMLTGKHSHLNGKRDNQDTFDGSQQTFPKLLQGAGYSTALIGKWHLESEPTGFDRYDILTDSSGQGQYYAPYFNENGESVQREGYVTDIITEKSLDYLNEARDTGKPFALLMHHKAPHRNWMPALKYLGSLDDVEIPIPDTFDDDYATRVPASQADMRVADMFLSQDMKLTKDYYGEETGTGGLDGLQATIENGWVESLSRLTPEERSLWDAYYVPINEDYANTTRTAEELAQWKYQRYMRDYLSCVMSVDESVGRVLDWLDENDLAENTIVVYTSDQGFYLGEHGWFDKRWMYEESFRTPLLMRYPAVVPAGTTATEMVMNLDFAPTFLDFAGVEVPSDMQGEPLRGVVTGNPPEDWRKSVYYHYYEYPDGWHSVRRHFGVRNDRYKLINFYNDAIWELYDLESDPHELNNVYSDPSYSDVVTEMKAELTRLRDYYGDDEF
jgi:arylsulfatase A-like enzyme